MGAAPDTFENEICQTIREIALELPETDEGTSCVNRAFSAGGKNFVFLGEKGSAITLRLKLEDGGWTKISFDAADAPDEDDLQAWIVESFRLLAPKKISALLD